MIATERVRLWLVDDEPVDLEVDGVAETYRLRIWRGGHGPAVVLVSPTPGRQRCSRVSSQLANLVHRAFLAYDQRGMHFLEKDGARFHAVNFLGVGRDDRLTLLRPQYREVSREDVLDLIGYAVAL